MKEKIKIWLKENWFKALIAFSVLLISLTIGFRYIVRPVINERRLTECLRLSENYSGSLRFDFGQTLKTPEETKALKEECFKIYPIK